MSVQVDKFLAFIGELMARPNDFLLSEQDKQRFNEALGGGCE